MLLTWDIILDSIFMLNPPLLIFTKNATNYYWFYFYVFSFASRWYRQHDFFLACRFWVELEDSRRPFNFWIWPFNCRFSASVANCSCCCWSKDFCNLEICWSLTSSCFSKTSLMLVFFLSCLSFSACRSCRFTCWSCRFSFKNHLIKLTNQRNYPTTRVRRLYWCDIKSQEKTLVVI